MKLPECFQFGARKVKIVQLIRRGRGGKKSPSMFAELVSGLQVCRAAVRGPLRTPQIRVLRAGRGQNGTIQSLGDTVPGTAVTQ